MKSIALEISPADIALFKAIVESYDNLLTLRTEDPVRHHLRIWYDENLEAEVSALLSSLQSTIPTRVLSR